MKDIYDAEKRLVRAIPKMAKAASADELRQAFEEHLEVTKGHVQRVEHYEMAASLAQRLRKEQIVELLAETGQLLAGLAETPQPHTSRA